MASFVNADPFGDPRSYSAQISWGDGSVSSGKISDVGNGTFAVSGGHTFASSSNYLVRVRIAHILGYTSPATTMATAFVTNLGFGQSQDAEYWRCATTGQALIKSFNGGANATGLSTWLATTFPDLFGERAGVSDVSGKTNRQVASFFQKLWDKPYSIAEGQYLATALNVYATTLSLGGEAGRLFGFEVTPAGFGNRLRNVGIRGLAFGVAEGTDLTVLQLLRAIDGEAQGTVQLHHYRIWPDAVGDQFELINKADKAGIRQDQFKPIGFWHDKHGQELIESFNGGPDAKSLSDWLSSSFANLFGSGARRNSLSGLTNTQVAVALKNLLAKRGDYAGGELLTVALNIYASTESLGGADGTAYGFRATPEGLGASSLSRGSVSPIRTREGDPRNVYQLLLLANQRVACMANSKGG